MSSAVWDAGEAAGAGDEAAGTAASHAGGESQAGSGYPETKDNGMDDTGNLFGNDLASKSEQAMTQQGAASGRGASGGFDTNVTNGTAYPSATTTLAKRRNSMAFEIARMERAGKTLPPANAQQARRVWDLSRPRYVEEASDHAPAIGGGGGRGGGKRRVRVPPGVERGDAVPYGVWSTSWAQMGDFGLDVGMYFVTLAQLVGAVLVYAALCVVAIVHFSSDQYSGPQVGLLPVLPYKSARRAAAAAVCFLAFCFCFRSCVSSLLNPFFWGGFWCLPWFSRVARERVLVLSGQSVQGSVLPPLAGVDMSAVFCARPCSPRSTHTLLPRRPAEKSLRPPF